MKKLTFTLIFVISTICVYAQTINFTDVNFKNSLLQADNGNYTASYNPAFFDASNYYWIFPTSNTIDINGDGEIQVSEAQLVKCLNLAAHAISDISEISYFTNLEHLDLTSNNLTNINVDQNLNLTYLNINSNQVTNLNVSQNASLQYLECYSNPISNINLSQNPLLKELNCGNCQLTSLNLSNNSNLYDLFIPNNSLTNINITNLVYLKYFNCSNNNLTSLNINNNLLLESLLYANNQLPNLNISHLTNLVTLNCINTNTTLLDLSPFLNLSNLDCSQNQLISLDLFNNVNLKSIICSENQLTNLILPNTANQINTLYCNNNNLLGINVKNIKLLYCGNNPLTYLNFLYPSNLRRLECPNTNLTEIDLSGTNLLNSLKVNSNSQLNIINLKNGYNNNSFIGPGSVSQELSISNCPNLTFICLDTEFPGEFNYFKNRINSLGYQNQIHLSSYCSFVPGGQFYTLQGQQKFDNESDGCDVTDAFIPNFKLGITNGTTTGTIVSNNSGNYSIPLQAGTYTVTPILENSSYFTVSPTSVVVSFPTQTSPVIQDFCVAPNGTKHDVEISIVPVNVARPGFDAKYKIIYKNKGNQTENGVINLQFDDAILDVVSTNPAFTTQTLNNLSFNYSNLNPFETREILVVLNVNSPMETPAVNADDILNYTVTITQLGSDEVISDNTFVLNQTVVNSMDPNDKTCLEGDYVSPDKIGEYVHYMIRFENTGTFPAENIVVKDMIDTDKFDVSSLIPLHASHNYATKITGNKVEFIFENINLPFDDANNDGYVAFKIKTLPTLVVGNTFSNLANIYFDYNFPIVTNTATTTIVALSNPSFEFANYFSLYPNPATNELNINLKSTIEINSIQIYNTIGQLVTVQTGNALKVDVSNLKTGNYFIKINTNEGFSTSQFIKE